jgi:hypothetical protein
LPDDFEQPGELGTQVQQLHVAAGFAFAAQALQKLLQDPRAGGIERFDSRAVDDHCRSRISAQRSDLRPDRVEPARRPGARKQELGGRRLGDCGGRHQLEVHR